MASGGGLATFVGATYLTAAPLIAISSIVFYRMRHLHPIVGRQ
jgi:hypothetical protein